MKKLSVIVGSVAVVMMASCGGVQRKPNDAYMPDMAYSRAVETYDDGEALREAGIHYTKMPVPGTVARGQDMLTHIPKDKPGDSTNYAASRALVNPVTSLNEHDMKEAERMYLIQCGICHGTKLDGNGPLYNGGNGKFSAAPAMLVGNAKYETMPAGQMFYSVTYGKNAMGPYGPQMTSKQRWMVIYYIKEQQRLAKGAAAGGSTAATADTTASKK